MNDAIYSNLLLLLAFDSEMNITLFSTWRIVNSVGGAEKVFCCFANAMASRGHNVTAICFEYEKGRPYYPLDSRVTFVNAGQGRKPSFFLSRPIINVRSLAFDVGKHRDKRVFLQSKFMGKYLSSAIQQANPDVIVCFQPKSAYLVHTLKTMAPIIVMNHSAPDIFLSNDMPPCVRKTLREVPVIQTLMPRYAKELKERIPETKVVCIPNVVSQRTDLANRSSHTIVNVGRVDSQKHQELLVDAFSLVANRYPDWVVNIWGENDVEPDRVKTLQNRINSRGMQTRIHLCGVTPDIFSKLKESSIFAFPSRHEGFSLALTEAMSVGLPAIGCKNSPAVNELIRDGANGFLCEDNPEDFARGLSQLMDCEELRIRLGDAAKEDMRAYAPELVWDQWERLLNSVVNREF